jgi:hypothetical protein
MDWDVGAIVEDLRFALVAAEAIVFLPLGVLGFIALFSLGVGYINPVWRQKRRQIEQRTNLTAQTLDALFKVVRHPLYTVFNATSGLCLVAGVAGMASGLAVLLYGVFGAKSQFFIGMGGGGLLLGILVVGASFIVTGACQMVMARTVATEDCISKLTEFEGDASEACVSIPESRVGFYRWRGLKIFAVSTLIVAGLWMSGSGSTITSSFNLVMGSEPSPDLTPSQK